MAEIDQFKQYIYLGYTNRKIAEYLGCSERTVKSRRKEYNLRNKDVQSAVHDAELDEMVKAAVGKNPSYGEKMVAGLLASKNVHVQRDRIRQSIRRVDPDGVETRKRVALHRRQYSVPGPNSLWHIDGNHKLIRWRYVIHGGIDGYSRIPVFLRCSTNNRAHTMLSAFKEGVLQYGLPWTVRSDKGGENTSVCAFMMAHPLRGPGRGHFITGRSVHNQRIERLWRDMFTGCASVYYKLFTKMEDENILDVTNEIDLAALHHVFLSIINNHLDIFQQSYLHHKLRTEHNKTPLQLWHSAIGYGFPMDFITEAEFQQYMPEQAGNETAAVNIPGGILLNEDQLLALNDNFSLDVASLQVEEDQISYFSAAKEFIYNLIYH
ncbi:uncharacterized protein [Apostichopus japonicus]|uniref:uncharacterized protein n=1 Tax=Stichopus japonicus TaxID=307972 RepID=UPI003AB3C533